MIRVRVKAWRPCELLRKLLSHEPMPSRVGREKGWGMERGACALDRDLEGCGLRIKAEAEGRGYGSGSDPRVRVRH